MKVKGNESADRPRVSEIAQQEAVRISTSKTDASLLAKKLKAQVDGALDPNADKVDVGLAKYINAELNPNSLAAESKQRIEKYKKLIESGEYKSDSHAVAQALSQEIAMEIFTNPSTDLLDEEV